MSRRDNTGVDGHGLRLLGKAIHALGIASDRREAGQCVGCGEEPAGEHGLGENCARSGSHKLVDTVIDAFFGRKRR